MFDRDRLCDTTAVVGVHPVHLINVGQRQEAADPLTKSCSSIQSQSCRNSLETARSQLSGMEWKTLVGARTWTFSWCVRWPWTRQIASPGSQSRCHSPCQLNHAPTRTVVSPPEMSMDWIHPWIGLDWIGLDWADDCYVQNYDGLCFFQLNRPTILHVCNNQWLYILTYLI